MDEPVQSPSVRKRQAHDEFEISISEAQKHQLPREKRPVITQISEETGIPSDISMIRQYSTNSHRLSDLNATNQDSSTSGVSRRRRRRLENSTLSGRDHTPRRTRAKRRLLSVILTVTLGVYLSKYLSRCVLTPRHAGLSSDTSPLGVQQGKSPTLSSGSRSAVTEKGRRLAAAEWGGGSDESPNTGSQSESKEPICEYPAASGVANASSVLRSQGTGHAVVGPLTGASSSSRGPAASGWELEAFRGQTAGVTHSGHTEAAPLNVSEFLETNFEPGSPSSEAALLREIASVVMSAAAAASEALGRVRLSSSGLRLALQHLGEGYGCLMEEAKSVEAGEKRESNDEGTAGLERPSRSRIGVADTDSPTAEPMPSSQTTAINRTQTSEALGNGPRPLSTRISFVSQVNSRYGRGSSLATIHESAPSEQADAGDEFDPWRHNGGSMFTDVVWDATDDGTQPSSLEEAMSIVGMDEGMVGGWNPFSSTTSTSDAWGKFVTDQSDARETAGDDANDVTGSPPRRPSYSEVVKHASRSLSAPPRSTAANGQGMAKRVAGLGQRLTSSGHRQSATSRDVSGGRRHYPSGPRVPGRRPTNRFESIDRSASHRRAGARPSLPSRPPPKPPLPQISKVGFGASGTPVQRGASQGGTPSGSEKRDGGEPSKDVKGQGEDAGQPGASGGPLGGAGGGGRRPGDDERDDDKRKKGKGSSSGGGEKKKEDQEKKAKKERDQREEAKKESKPVGGREARGKEVKQGGGGLSSDSGKGSTGEEAGKKKAKKDRGRRAIEETVGDDTDAGVTSEATGGVPKEAEPQKDGEDRGVHGGGRGGEGPGSAGATETGDAVQHDSGGIGSGSEDRDKSRSETAAREKQDSKRQKSSGGRRKKKGASVAPQTGQTTTGEAPRSAVDSEGGRAGPLAASDKNKAGTDEGGRDAKGDEDGEAATAGPRAGAQHTGEHGGETEVVGETVKVAEADEEGSDAAAQREALRTGARPKTSSAAGRRKQKMKEQHAEQAESVSTRVSAAAEDQEVPSRGRARHRTRAPDTRAGTGGSQKGVKASLGPSDGKGGQDGDVTVVSGKPSTWQEDQAPQVRSSRFTSMAPSLRSKLRSVVTDHLAAVEQLKAEPGGDEFMGLIGSDKFIGTAFRPAQYHMLTRLILLKGEYLHRLEALFEVASGLHKAALEQRTQARRTSGALPKVATARSRDAGYDIIGIDESPFSGIIIETATARDTARQEFQLFLQADTACRCADIARVHLPPVPDLGIPLFPTEEGYDPDSQEVVYTSSGIALRAADPVSVAIILRDTLLQWQAQVESVISDVEAKWWDPPSDPDEARRQHERTTAVFKISATYVSWHVLADAMNYWGHATIHLTDPALKAGALSALKHVASAQDEILLLKREYAQAYSASYRQTAKANVRNPQNRWDPLPDNGHAPDVRGAAELDAQEGPADTQTTKEPPADVAAVQKTHEEQETDGSV